MTKLGLPKFSFRAIRDDDSGSLSEIYRRPWRFVVSEKENPIDQTRLAIAALTACLVKALEEMQPGVQARFEDNVDNAYRSIRSATVAHVGAMETLTWVRDYLKKL